ncbi:hypothetical protein CHRYSEO8AT_440023 [Chryseobacterium sp. 8AT]|nr:hypothetical protein CHRYSEO8AT_440023 [Chryseobacterium sp. 8AT]
MSFSQYFKFTPKGFASNDNNEFTVVNVPNVKNWFCTKMFSMSLTAYTIIRVVILLHQLPFSTTKKIFSPL